MVRPLPIAVAALATARTRFLGQNRWGLWRTFGGYKWRKGSGCLIFRWSRPWTGRRCGLCGSETRDDRRIRRTCASVAPISRQHLPLKTLLVPTLLGLYGGGDSFGFSRYSRPPRLLHSLRNGRDSWRNAPCAFLFSCWNLGRSTGQRKPSAFQDWHFSTPCSGRSRTLDWRPAMPSSLPCDLPIPDDLAHDWWRCTDLDFLAPTSWRELWSMVCKMMPCRPSLLCRQRIRQAIFRSGRHCIFLKASHYCAGMT